jgi:hypothetical protein
MPKALPFWLASLSAQSMGAKTVPLREILEGALYYPACGVDGGPVQHMGAELQSFIYVDYGLTRASILDALADQPFKGYEVLGMRSVSEVELTPQGWEPPALTPEEFASAKAATERWQRPPFCEWIVFERAPGLAEPHGPHRFSLLCLCADGVAAFKALYVDKGLRPRAIAVIQPGHGFGRNWTDFTDPHGPLARVVMNNPAGAPHYFLMGGLGTRHHHASKRWPQYQNLHGWYGYHARGNVGIWSLDCDPNQPNEA